MTAGITEPSVTTDFVLAVGQDRTLECRSGMLILRESGGKRWQTQLGPARVLAGSTLVDDRAAVHIAGRSRRDQILVFALRDGAIERRISLDHATVVFARDSGLAIALVSGSLVIAIDLRHGGVIANRPVDQEIVDLSIDDTGATIELWGTERSAIPAGRIEIATLTRLARGTTPPPLSIATDPTTEASPIKPLE